MAQHLMILPTLVCPAECAYCFGPHAASPRMGRAVVEAAAGWQAAENPGEALEITFHGGEPLAAGVDFYRWALPLLTGQLRRRRLRLGLQSNLWLLTDELCDLFAEQGVSLGTSLDGPEAINDAQRGAGYFQRTMAGIRRARAYGLEVSCICTFTAQSAPYADEIYDFFAGQGLNFSVHAALPGLAAADGRWALSAEDYGVLLEKLLECYLADLPKLRIGTLDAICWGISAGCGGLCTFSDCLGRYLAVDPQGWVYACQRFAGRVEHRLGNVLDQPGQANFPRSPAWQRLQVRQQRVAEECAGCPHFKYCRGGCPYNSLAAGVPLGRDPYCPAYQRIFNTVIERAVGEVFSTENMQAVLAQAGGKAGLLRKGALLQIMRSRTHQCLDKVSYGELQSAS
jgi:uncharacterized protein